MDIDKIISTPMDDLRFRDFMRLKCGRDEFSRLRLPALRERVSYCDVADTEAALESDADRAKVYRWILRGLPCDKAIRKVKTDLEVSENCKPDKRNPGIYGDGLEFVNGVVEYDPEKFFH